MKEDYQELKNDKQFWKEKVEEGEKTLEEIEKLAENDKLYTRFYKKNYAGEPGTEEYVKAKKARK